MPITGALQAHAIRFIDPSSFHYQAVFVLSIIFSGLASMPGTLIGRSHDILPEAVDMTLSVSSTAIGAIRGKVFSFLLLLVVLFRPTGLLGKVELPSAYGEE